MKGFLKKHAYWLKWVFSLGLLIVVLLKIEWSTLGSALLLVSWWYYPLALLLVLFAQVLATWRWRLFLPEDRFWTLFRFNLIAQFYAFSLPSTLSGDVMKVVHIHHEKRSASYYAATVFVDKIIGLLALFILLSIATFNSTIAFFQDIFILGLVSSLALTTILLVITTKRTSSLFLRLLHFFRLKQFDSFIQAVREMIKNWRVVSACLFLAFLFQFVAVLIYALCELFLVIQLTFQDYLICITTVQVVSMLPFTVGGIGLKDVSFVFLLSFYGVEKEMALALSFINYPQLLFLVILGYFSILQHNRLSHLNK
jgi:glycosyltransferase 2 family protein